MQVRWLRRAACGLAVLTVLATFLAGCQFSSDHGTPVTAPCSFGGLVLVPVVCIRAEPGRRSDGTWTFPASNPQAAGLRPGSILVIARRSVRRVESVQRAGDQVILTTAAVPLTEVVKDGTIPLNASITPSSIERTVDLPPPPPPPPPEPVGPEPSPSHTSQSPKPPVTPMISVSVRTIRNKYGGPCAAASADQEPAFEGTFSVSAGPVTVAYRWTLTDPKGTTTSIPGTLTFPGSGPQTQTADYTVPVNQYVPDTDNEGTISLQVASPVTAAAPEQLRYNVSCTSASTSPPSTSTASPSGSTIVSGSRPAGDQPARLLADTGLEVDGYQIDPSLALSNDSFIVDITAARGIGPAELKWKVHGELENFLSGGALHIVSHQLRDSSLGTTGLRGQLRFDWSLSAQVPEGVANNLSLDLPIRLFVQALPVGDFPVFLAVEIHLHIGPEFTPGQALHGYASVSFSGGQGLSIHLRAIDRPTGPSIGGLHLDPGIRDLFRLPTLRSSVDFPYISLGDDFYSTGAFLWASPSISISILPGHDPGTCARTETDASASAGTEFELFGLRAALTTQVFDHALPPDASFPRSPECIIG
jgi:hypothetical protein